MSRRLLENGGLTDEQILKVFIAAEGLKNVRTVDGKRQYRAYADGIPTAKYKKGVPTIGIGFTASSPYAKKEWFDDKWHDAKEIDDSLISSVKNDERWLKDEYKRRYGVSGDNISNRNLVNALQMLHKTPKFTSGAPIVVSNKLGQKDYSSQAFNALYINNEEALNNAFLEGADSKKVRASRVTRVKQALPPAPKSYIKNPRLFVNTLNENQDILDRILDISKYKSKN